MTRRKISLPERIQAMRLALEMSQQDLADACGWSRSYQSQLETGHRNLGVQSAKTLGPIFGVEWYTLMEDL